MLAAALSILALVGGVSVTFFIMDAPRRKAHALRRALNAERDQVQRDAAEIEHRARNLTLEKKDLYDDIEHRKRALSGKISEVKDAEAALASRVREFQSRVITLEDLRTENGLLKTDLRNLALLVAQREQRANGIGRERAKVLKHRDALGEALLAEVRDATRRGMTVSNYPASKRRIETVIQKLANAGVETSEALQQKIMEELRQQYEIAVRASIEREEQARIREEIRDQHRLERQRQDAIEQAEQERRLIEAALNTALGEAAGRHAEEVDRLRAMLAEAEAKSMRAISQAQITKVGHVYVISNIGSFGQGTFKIGLTRREDPMERVDELGSASVPFPFDVHMLIKANDAPKLEYELHKAFRHRRVNRANPRKEFFRVTIEEIANAVRAHHGEVEYIADAKALEYLQSQSMTDEEMEEVSSVFDRIESTSLAIAVED